MIYYRHLGCDGCFKPGNKRLGTLQSRDYECYGESYVKCFWQMTCDHQKPEEAFTMKSEAAVITDQPRRTAYANNQLKLA